MQLSKGSSFLGARGHRLKLYMLLLMVAPTFILFGYNNGSTGSLFTLESFVKQFPSIDTVTTVGGAKSQASRLKGIVTGCYDLGAVAGSLTSIAYGEKIGRLRTILVGLIISLIGLAIESSSFSLGQLIVGRLVIGCSIGIISAQVPVWHTDCSSTQHRGRFVIFEGFCISLGITITEWVSFGLSFATTQSGQWRGPLVFPAVFALFAIPFTFLLPESPRWLVSKERHEEARNVLSALRDLPRDSTQIDEEISIIQSSLAIQKRSVWDLRKNGEDRLLHRTVLAMVAQMMQQLCAISALVFYTSDIFANLGFSSLHARVIGACLSTFQTLCSIIPLFTVDRFGRRKLFMFTTIGLSICTAVIAGTGAPLGFGGTTHKSIVAVVFTFAFDFFYPIGLLGLTFLYAAEISPTPYRVPITAIANAVQWLFQFMVAQITPPGTDSLRNRYWIIYAVLNAAFAVIIFFFFPETSGRSLEEMDLIFRNTTSIFTVVETSRTFLKAKQRQIITNETSPSVISEDSNLKEVTPIQIERV